MIEPKILIRNIAVIFLFTAIIFYSLWRGRTAIFGITIDVDIVDGQSLPTNLVTLTGNAENASRFTINGREILLDKDGNFSEPLLLLPGYSIIELSAQDHFGRSTNKLLRVYEKEDIYENVIISS